MHGKLPDNEEQLVVVPVVAPVAYHLAEQLVVHSRTMVVALALVPDNAGHRVGRDTLYHALVEHSRGHRVQR